MTTLMEKSRKTFLRKFHTICTNMGLEESAKRSMIESYGGTSSRDLTAHQLLDIINKLEGIQRPKLVEMDRYRKRVIASIFAWRKATGNDSNMNEVKAIACRAASADSFNDIPLERLRSLYNAFVNKTRDLQFVDQVTTEEIAYKQSVN